MSAPKIVKPHPRYLTKLYISTLVIAGLFVLPWILLGLIPELGWAYVLIFVLANALWMVPTFLLFPLYFKSIHYEIGESELIAHQGILTQSVKTVPYRTITDLEVKRGPLDRWLFNLGSLEVQTAGQSAQAGAEVRLVGLADWSALRAEIVERLRAYRASSGTGAEVEAKAGGDTELLRQILAEIKGLREDVREE
ncbi:MAG: PH domain-containing protein [Chloroflexi bacterium]|mgnify:FL=1|nr:PH domain-containing protein [Chloroflexota bacterium]